MVCMMECTVWVDGWEWTGYMGWNGCLNGMDGWLGWMDEWDGFGWMDEVGGWDGWMDRLDQPLPLGPLLKP